MASLRNQTLEEIEMIFIDDCGTDGAMDVVRKAAEEDSRIRILTNAENMGPGASRNAGIEVARGEYLAFVDADDYVDLDFIEILYTKAKTDGLDIVKGNYFNELEDGMVIIKFNQLNERICQNLSEGIPLFCVFTHEFQSGAFRKNLFTNPDIRFGQATIGEDITFLLKACLEAKSFAIADGATYHYVFRKTSAVNVITDASLVNRIAALKEKMQYLVMYVEPNPFATRYLADQIKYLLSVQWHVSKDIVMKDLSQRFLMDLKDVASRYPYIGALKEQVFSIAVLFEYGENVTEWPYESPWEVLQPLDYWEFIMHKATFLMNHPECSGELPNLFAKARWYARKMEVEGIPKEEIKNFQTQVEALRRRPKILRLRLRNKFKK